MEKAHVPKSRATAMDSARVGSQPRMCSASYKLPPSLSLKTMKYSGGYARAPREAGDAVVLQLAASSLQLKREQTKKKEKKGKRKKRTARAGKKRKCRMVGSSSGRVDKVEFPRSLTKSRARGTTDCEHVLLMLISGAGS